MHGATELRQDIRELCVKNEYGTDAWFKFAVEMNRKCNVQNADSCYKDVAKSLDYDVKKIEDCESNNKIKYSEENLRLNSMFGVRGSPTIIIDGEIYTGNRDANSVKNALCSAFEHPPKECNQTINPETDTRKPSGSCG